MPTELIPTQLYIEGVEYIGAIEVLQRLGPHCEFGRWIPRRAMYAYAYEPSAIIKTPAEVREHAKCRTTPIMSDADWVLTYIFHGTLTGKLKTKDTP